MDEQIINQLKALEPNLRAASAQTGGDISVTISMDQNGTSYSFSINDGQGSVKTYNERVMRRIVVPAPTSPVQGVATPQSIQANRITQGTVTATPAPAQPQPKK